MVDTRVPTIIFYDIIELVVGARQESTQFEVRKKNYHCKASSCRMSLRNCEAQGINHQQVRTWTKKYLGKGETYWVAEPIYENT